VKAGWRDFFAKIPGPVTADWPDGEPFAEVLRHGTMSVEIFAPRGKDHQTPHEQDELYFVQEGRATFVRDDQPHAVSRGDVLFVPAHALHRFEDMSEDFSTWVVFWGPPGGESHR
jgi:mannose-6-phosphate isomerase-like protein (cupin superfamily)